MTCARAGAIRYDAVRATERAPNPRGRWAWIPHLFRCMQPTHNPDPNGQPASSGSGGPPPAEPTQAPVVREKSDDPAVIITRTGASYNTRVMTAAVVAIALIFAVWVIMHRRNAPGSDVAGTSGGEVAVDSSPIPGRQAPADSLGAATPYWPAIPYANGQPTGQVITPSPYTTMPAPYPSQSPMYAEPPVPPPAPQPAVPPGTPATAPTPTMPRNSGPPATTPRTTVFPRLDSILGVPTDSQGRARVPQRADTVTHIDSVLRGTTTPQPKPAAPPHVDTTVHATVPPPRGSTTRADTSFAKDSV